MQPGKLPHMRSLCPKTNFELRKQATKIIEVLKDLPL